MEIVHNRGKTKTQHTNNIIYYIAHRMTAVGCFHFRPLHSHAFTPAKWRIKKPNERPYWSVDQTPGRVGLLRIVIFRAIWFPLDGEGTFVSLPLWAEEIRPMKMLYSIIQYAYKYEMSIICMIAWCVFVFCCCYRWCVCTFVLHASFQSSLFSGRWAHFSISFIVFLLLLLLLLLYVVNNQNWSIKFPWSKIENDCIVFQEDKLKTTIWIKHAHNFSRQAINAMRQPRHTRVMHT